MIKYGIINKDVAHDHMPGCNAMMEQAAHSLSYTGTC